MQMAVATETKRVSYGPGRKTSMSKYNEAVSVVGRSCAAFYIQNYITFHMFCVCFGRNPLIKLVRSKGIEKALRIITAPEIPQWVID